MREEPADWDNETKPRPAIPAIPAITREARAERAALGRHGAFGASLPPGGPTAPGKRLMLIAAVALVVVALVGGSIAYTLTQRHHAARVATPIPRELSLDLTTLGLYCPRSVTWSPDSLSLAVIADSQDCGAAGGGGVGMPSMALVILNARAGTQARRFDITSLMAEQGLTPAVDRIGVAWSHDSSTVYVGIGGFASADHSLDETAALLVANVISGASRLTISAATDASPIGVIWSLDGRPTATPILTPLAPAQSYHWSAAGLTPGQPLPANLTIATGVANPSDALGFWQAGTVSPSYQPSNEYAAALLPSPEAMFYDTQTSQVAPSGATFASDIWLDTRIPAPGAPSFDPGQCLMPFYTSITSQACPTTVAPYPDKALAAVAAAVESGVQIGPGNTQWLQATIAWRPDGALLAALLPNQSVTAQGSPLTLTVYSARSGAVVKTFVLQQSAIAGPFQVIATGVSPAQWSPSGQQLALVDFGDSSITIWDARGLVG